MIFGVDIMMIRFKVVGVGTTCRMRDLNGIRALFPYETPAQVELT